MLLTSFIWLIENLKKKYKLDIVYTNSDVFADKIRRK